MLLNFKLSQSKAVPPHALSKQGKVNLIEATLSKFAKTDV